MTQDYKHPITPPEELVQQWVDTYFGGKISQSNFHVDLAARAAQYGADQELQACCAYMQHEDFHGFATELRAARRPKSPRLKKQALDAHNRMMAGEETQDDWAIVRRALEQLDD
jgi:hypothetical protein